MQSTDVKFRKVLRVMNDVKELELSIPGVSDTRLVLAKFFRAIADPNRLLLLEFLVSCEHTGNECVAHVRLAQSRVSSHLQCLVNCGFVRVRREGHFAYYRVVDERVIDLVEIGREIASDHSGTILECTRVTSS
ncbi:HTH-type transcriptional repressor CzrA [Acidithrix ferrooxidans]|uniref:HTH-type transcriptional repressor CzrA n=2 Tax=Acidithrix ferrooxidans TaxID=1280514 RepID=A0A0D8HJX3_9ACTN|nr:HTH-type transcriptional repressor CzrA [Acidithrix ferrooxidans]